MTPVLGSKGQGLCEDTGEASNDVSYDFPGIERREAIRISYLANNRLKVWGSSALGILVSFTLFCEVLIDLIVCENGRLRFNNLHGCG
jgi:hypothetical protein